MRSKPSEAPFRRGSRSSWAPSWIPVLVLGSVWFAGTPGPAWAKSPERPVTVRDLAALSFPYQASFSHDSEWIAYTLRTGNLDENRLDHQIYIVPRRGGEPRAVTSGKTAAEHPSWSPRGDYVSFERAPDKDGETQVWVLPLDGGEAVQITELEAGVIQHAWSRDGGSILVLAPEEDPPGLRDLLKDDRSRGYDARQREKVARKRLWRYPVPDGKPEIVYDGDPGIDEFAASPDGELIAFRSNGTGIESDADEVEIYVLRPGDGKVRRTSRRNGEESTLRWTHDSESLIFTASQIDTLAFSQQDVFVIPLGPYPSEALEAVPTSRWIPWSQNFDRAIVDFIWPELSGQGYVIAHDGLSSRLAALDGEGSAHWLTDKEEIVRAGGISPDGNWLALTVESVESPPRLLLADRRGNVARVLADPNKELFADVTSAPHEAFHWRSVDGRDIEGLLLRPWRTEAKPPYPLVVYLHGGPDWNARTRLACEPQIWAGEGYLVLAPNYRGSTGYGGEFATANLHDIGGGDFEDVMSGVERLTSDGLADDDRVAIMGTSYGAYLANVAVTKTDRFAAAVSEFGIFNLITDLSNSVYPQWDRGYLGSFYWENLKPYLEMSPAFSADLITTPVLLMHGEDDENTFVSNSLEMYTALKLLDRTVEFHVFPREGHGFFEPSHVIQEAVLTRRWLDRHVTSGAIWPPGFDNLRSAAPEQLPSHLADLLRSVEGLPRLYRLGDTLSAARGVPVRGIVTRVSIPESYGTEKPQGRFLEVNVLLSQDAGKANTFQIKSGEIVLLESSGRIFQPVGVPVSAHGRTTLVRGQDFQVRLLPGEDGSPGWHPITVTYDVPVDRFALPIIIGPLPPVLINVGEADRR